jgi:hypothetical protein
MEEATNKKNIKMNSKMIVRIISVIVIVGLIGLLVMVYKKNNTPEKRKAAETGLLMKNIGKHYFIPNERPIIATINEAEKLIAEQPFYANVQNGDKLVIFPVAQKAIIYSPKLDKIVNSGPFVLDNSAPTKSPAPAK